MMYVFGLVVLFVALIILCCHILKSFLIILILKSLPIFNFIGCTKRQFFANLCLLREIS